MPWCVTNAPTTPPAGRSRRTEPNHYQQPFTNARGRGRLEGGEGPEQTPIVLWRTPKGYAATSLEAGPSPQMQLERRQMTHPRSHQSV